MTESEEPLSLCAPRKEATAGEAAAALPSDRWPLQTLANLWTDGAQRLEAPAPAAAAGGIMAELLPPLCHFPTHELGLIPQSYVLLLRVLRKKKIR